jgi:hypothetical protein
MRVLHLATLFMLFFSLLSLPCKANSTIIRHYDLVGENNRIICAVYIYQDSDSSPTEDFYALKIHVYSMNGSSSNAFGGVVLNITSLWGVIDLWEPTAGWKGEQIIGFSYAHISFTIWIPTEYVEFSGGFTGSVKWFKVIPLLATEDSFAVGYWVKDKMPFDIIMKLKAFYYHSDFGYWEDNVKLWVVLEDIDNNGCVDIRDVALVSRAFGLTETSPNWNPNLDVYKDGRIDIKDICLVSKLFGLALS